ncbi:MAG: hypothetical protein IJX87_00935 [Clostridia bacterium]|nr:hypothetical protein [Clostridia bacterium]
MKQSNYEAPCLTYSAFENADVLTASTEYGVNWTTAGWQGVGGSTTDFEGN